MQRLMKIAGASCVTTSNCSFLEVGMTEKSSAQVKTLIFSFRGLITRTSLRAQIPGSLIGEESLL